MVKDPLYASQGRLPDTHQLKGCLVSDPGTSPT